VLEIVLGPLTKKAFNDINRYFSSQSKPVYLEQKQYRLVEFLPPLFQALEGWQFSPILESYEWPHIPQEDVDNGSVEIADLARFSNNKTPVATLINCWTTAYEILRNWKTPGHSTEVDITWLSRTTATTILTQEKMTRLKTSEKLKFGDLLVFSDFSDDTAV